MQIPSYVLQGMSEMHPVAKHAEARPAPDALGLLPAPGKQVEVAGNDDIITAGRSQIDGHRLLIAQGVLQRPLQGCELHVDHQQSQQAILLVHDPFDQSEGLDPGVIFRIGAQP